MNKNLRFVIFRCLFKFFLTIFFTFLFSFTFAQVKFSASSNDKTIGKNDYLQVQFTIENAANVENITPPSFKNFSIVSGPNQQSSMSIINGKMTQSVSVGFVLQPLTKAE